MEEVISMRTCLIWNNFFVSGDNTQVKLFDYISPMCLMKWTWKYDNFVKWSRSDCEVSGRCQHNLRF